MIYNWAEFAVVGRGRAKPASEAVIEKQYQLNRGYNLTTITRNDLHLPSFQGPSETEARGQNSRNEQTDFD
jgi:hypothetical protein